MGMREYFVTKNEHSEKEFVDAFGKAFYCVSKIKRDVTGIDYKELPEIKAGTELVVLYGDKYDLDDTLDEKFPDVIYLGTEFIYDAVFGVLRPTQEQVKELCEARAPIVD